MPSLANRRNIGAIPADLRLEQRAASGSEAKATGALALVSIKVGDLGPILTISCPALWRG